MKNRKGMSGAGITAVILLLLVVLGLVGAGIWFVVGGGSESQSVTNVKQVAQETKSGTASSVKVYVEDRSANNIHTKLATAVYCVDQTGSFIIDGTTSSTSAEITGSTTIGSKVTCYAFDSTHQTYEPVVLNVQNEIEHVVIPAFTIPTNGHIQIYNDQYATGTGGTVNVTSVTASGTGTLQKMRYTNNNTNTIFPLGGFYFAKVASSNISEIDISGSAVLSGFANNPSTSIVASSLSTDVTTRSDNWDAVFEVDEGSSVDGMKKALLVEENDYLETGTVAITGNGNGCTSSPELVSMYAFSKGYYQKTLGTGIGYGHETDASSSSVISADLTGDTFYCS